MRFDNDPKFSEVTTQMIIQRDASLTGWGAVFNGVQTSGQCPGKNIILNINVLELLAIKFALFSFTKGKRMKNIQFVIHIIF